MTSQTVLWRVIAVIGVLCSFAVLTRSQEGLVIPEYFGFYSIENGKTVAIYEGQGTASPKTMSVDLYSFSNKSTIEEAIPELSSGARFILFYANAGEMVKDMTLHRLPLLRNFVETPDTSQLAMGLMTKQMPAPRIIANLNEPFLARIPDLELRILAKPVPNQPQMIEMATSPQLTPGIYVLDYDKGPHGRDGWFAVFAVAPAASEKRYCVDLTLEGGMGAPFFQANSSLGDAVPALLNGQYKACDGVPQAKPTSSESAPVSAPAVGASQGIQSSCSDFNSCIQSGRTAFHSSNWQQALGDFERASDQRRDGLAWVWIGNTYLAMNRPSDASSAWDKALALNFTVGFNVCHDRGIQPCELGALQISPKEVSFLVAGRALFTVPPSEFAAKGSQAHRLQGFVDFGADVQGKKYSFEFIPFGVTCSRMAHLSCTMQQGPAQQIAVGEYISRTVPKLASGGMVTVQASGGVAPSGPPCGQTTDLGYSIVLQGHLYKVRAGSSSGANRSDFFFDEEGAQVTDHSIVGQLASAAWTRDNVVASPDSRNGVGRVSGILGTSVALQQYSAVQDVLARAMVEALEAAATGGTSLTKVIPKLTVGMISSQIKSAPKTLFTLLAQRGLQMSLDAYQQMESVPIPPPDATAINASDLVRVKILFLQARSLELPYEALAAKLMPAKESDLTDQAFQSAFTEVLAGPLFAGVSPSSPVTAKNLVDLQKQVQNLAKTLPALQAYSQNLNLALNLSDANNRSISQLASTAAVQGCGESAAQEQAPSPTAHAKLPDAVVSLLNRNR